MPCVVIDNRSVDVPEGGTILDAARKAGVDIPALCFLDGYRPLTSCMVCQVKLPDDERMVPACATVAEDGMRIESETEEVRRIRRTALELLLSDHVGDCVAPCQIACPLHMDIPLMLRQVAAGDLGAAAATVRRGIALPGVLSHVCHQPCERACRRGKLDSPVSVCLVKRLVTELSQEADAPYLPPCGTSTGRRVAVVGAGSTGLSAAYHLRQMGHACTVFDDQPLPGGALRNEFDEGQLPRAALDADIAVIEKMGVELRMNTVVGQVPSLADLRKEFEAVLVAIGSPGDRDVEDLGLSVSEGRLQANAKTHETSTPGVFAAGRAIAPSKLIARSVADGKNAALCIDQYLSGGPVVGEGRRFNFHSAGLDSSELARMAGDAGAADRVIPSGGLAAGLTAEEARVEALRCLHCDCGKQEGCRLREYAQAYGARANRYRGPRKEFERRVQHGDVVYEPGKCIVCGLCVQIAAEAGEALGVTFVGRGFDVHVDVPFDGTIAEGLGRVALRCAAACPTGALALRLSHSGNQPRGRGCSSDASKRCGSSPLPPPPAPKP